MPKLIERKPKRIFTFGCSFTNYVWGTWANIIGYEFNDCEWWDFGKSGAGNQFISLMITQADAYYQFTEDDLVLVNWTNISREDRYQVDKVKLDDNPGAVQEIEGRWITPGNIFSQNEFDQDFVSKWANMTYYAMRDFSTIAMSYEYLKNTNCQFHFMQMCEISETLDQWEGQTKNVIDEKIKTVIDLYQPYLQKILPSFYRVLWNDDIGIKWKRDWRHIHRYFSDGHPLPIEHLEYLQKTFDYEFSERTILEVKRANKGLVKYIQKGYEGINEPHGLYQFPSTWVDTIQKFKIRRPNGRPPGIIY